MALTLTERDRWRRIAAGELPPPPPVTKAQARPTNTMRFRVATTPEERREWNEDAR